MPGAEAAATMKTEAKQTAKLASLAGKFTTFFAPQI